MKARSIKARRAIPTWRLWVYRGISLLFPVLLLVVAELSLRGLGFGYETRLVQPVASAPGWYQFNRNTGRAYADRGVGGPSERPMQIPKPAGTYRVVVLGESSVQGFPYSTEQAFPAHLEILLQRQMSDRKCEVLNAGIVAISSPAIVDLTRQALAVDPDLLVVYAGHNEFYGFGGAASNTSALTPWWIGLRRWRLTQVTHQFLFAGDPNANLISRLPADLNIAVDSPSMAAAQANYRANLTSMAAIAADAGVPLVLCNVACNLRNQSPMHSTFSPHLAEDQRQLLLRCLAEADKLRLSNQPEAALAALATAEKIDSGYALVSYRRGQCLESLERFEEAAKAYSMARDLDGCRFRAPGAFRAIVESVAAERDAHYVDVAAALAGETKYAAPGDDFFLDHVHFTWEGAWHVAQAISRVAIEQAEGRPWNTAAIPTAAERDAALAVVPEDHLQALSFIAMMPELSPLNGAVEVELVADWARQQCAKIEAQQSPAERQAYALQLAHCREDPAFQYYDMALRMGICLVVDGETQTALRYAERAIVRQPYAPNGYILEGGCHDELGNRAKALECLREAETKPLGSDQRFKTLAAALRESLGSN